MTERTGFLLGDVQLTLLGDEIKVGDTAPEFSLPTPDLSPVSLSSVDAPVKLLVVVPSLDTGVCEMETVRFNKEVASLGDNVQTFIISADLPFAQGRFATEKQTENVKYLSDHFDMQFGDAYGVHIKELRLLNRSVFVLDKNNKVTYVEYLKQNTDQPDYDKVLAAVKALL